jgi:DNA modification methylase/DNA-directed RNA polymerase subunit RPC12/RpoP
MGVRVIQGDVREVYRQLGDGSIDCVITSPPYYRQRDYGVAGQIGQEGSPEEYAKEIANVFRLLWDKLKTTATVFLNIGYKYENEEFLLVPELVAWEMRKVGYVLKNKIIWHKPNAMPTSARNRLNNTYEAVLFFVKNVGKEVYYFNLEEVSQKPQLSYTTVDLLGLTVEDSLTFSFKRVGRILETQDDLVKVLWKDGVVEWLSFSLQQWRAKFVCVRCGQVLGYWDVHLEYANRGRFECKYCGESSLPKPLLAERSFDGKGKAGVFQNKSRKYERAKLLASSPSGRLAVAGEKLITKRKWLFPQGLIADYLREKLKEKGISVKKLGELMGRTHTVGHWLRKDFSHWGKGGSIPRPEDWLKLKEILGFDGTYDRLILDRIAVLSTVKSHPEGKNIGDVWEIATEPYKGEHFAVFPRKLVEMCIKLGCPEGGTVLDPFAGSGTVGEVAVKLGRNAVLIEINPDYIKLIRERLD